MELAKVIQMDNKNPIPMFGVESTTQSIRAFKPFVKAESTAEERCCQIVERAYFKAEARGFVAGHEMEDWLAAELEVSQ
jgi:hypothetical protein